jgi:hypothetical protein
MKAQIENEEKSEKKNFTNHSIRVRERKFAVRVGEPVEHPLSTSMTQFIFSCGKYGYEKNILFPLKKTRAFNERFGKNQF